ncbi:hypothetical protein N656DRAFT_706956 [Canariomyces notabilis]|uniref:CST complex subunit Ten1 n=1 Tax=Canariomyces notabilis TaxID=2074819 RepID=A0AAN6TG83_9PEZI|nr:hypothetical protein N656DRAFT_706956 [Canariomyces arenarius]
MSTGPPPSQLCLLSTLPLKQVGDKVRFLACVSSYSPVHAILTLEHRLSGDACSVLALVDVNLILERIGANQTRTGEWVNVIGYITDIAPMNDGKRAKGGNSKIQVQALLLWSAGPLDVQKYTASVRALEC